MFTPPFFIVADDETYLISNADDDQLAVAFVHPSVLFLKYLAVVKDRQEPHTETKGDNLLVGNPREKYRT